MKSAEIALLRLMSRQYSLATRRQALTAGMTARQIELRLQTGAWVAPHRGVYRPASMRRTFEHDVMAACLAADGVASGPCAAALWKLRGFRGHAIEIVTSRDRRANLAGVAVRRAVLHSLDRTTLGPIPITTVAKTLLHIAATHPQLLEHALNDALCRNLTRPARIWSMLARADGRGRKGALHLAEILSHLAAPTESVLEDDFLTLVRRHGLPEPVRQFPIAGGEFRLDFAWPDARVVYETHGWRHHSAPADRRRDRAKRRAAEAEGWNWNDAYWEDVHEWGADTAAQLGSLLRQGRAAA
jgi:hypothetical protein